jgi:hypothetical protein
MQKLKEHNFIIKNEFDKIIIRSIKNTDLSFYKDWFKNGHILKDSVDTVSEEEVEKWILHDTKTKYIFIIEFNKKPCGEIVLWNDTTLIISDKYYKKPYYNIMIKFYENINNNDIDDIINLFITSINKLKIKIGTLYVFIDEKEEQNYTDDYMKNGFKYINKELYKTKLEKFFEKKNMENPYNKLRILIKNV